MRIQLLSLIIIFSLLVSFPAIASDWVFVASDKGSTFAMYIDKQSIEGDLTGRKFWEKVVWKKEQIYPISGKYFIMYRNYQEIDCKNNTLKTYEMNLYSNDGELVEHWLNPSPDTKMRIAPDTTVEAEKKFVCSFKQTK